MGLHLVKTSHSVNPWRLEVRCAFSDGRTARLLDRVAFRTKRDGLPWLAQLTPLANWDTPPTTWPQETLNTVWALVETIPSVQAAAAHTAQHYAAALARRGL